MSEIVMPNTQSPTPKEEMEMAALRRRSMINHSVKVLAGQGVKAITILSVEEAQAALDCDPQQAARTLDLAAASMADTVEYKTLLTPYYERVLKGETAASYLKAKEVADGKAKTERFCADPDGS